MEGDETKEHVSLLFIRKRRCMDAYDEWFARRQ
jgi:hypothetical protein